jgi:hypothetical protein
VLTYVPTCVLTRVLIYVLICVLTRYQKLCKVLRRHPNTPKEPESWPPAVDGD